MLTATWYKKESAKLAETQPLGSNLERQTIRRWRKDSPKAAARLAKAKALPQAAHVMTNLMLEMERNNLKQGMPPTDARESAERQFLVLEA